MAMGRRALKLSKKKLKQAQREEKRQSSTTATNVRDTTGASGINVVENGVVIPSGASAHLSGATEGFAAAAKSGGAYANASGGGEQGDAARIMVTAAQGLAALVLAHPYEVPQSVPPAIDLLTKQRLAAAATSRFLLTSKKKQAREDPATAVILDSRAKAAAKAVEDIVKLAFTEFKRTHQDDWANHREAFDEEILDAFNDTFEAPSYFC